MKSIFKLYRYLPTLAFFLITSIKTYSQSGNYVVSRIDNDAYTTKYEYDNLRRVISFTIFDKRNLNKVTKYRLLYSPNKIVVTYGGGKLTDQTLITDTKGRITSGTYNADDPNIFSYNYKFNYSPDGYLKRINYYEKGNNKLAYIHELGYTDGNLTTLTTTFNPETNNEVFANSPRNASTDKSFMAGDDYEMTYYLQSSNLNMNLLWQILFIDKQFGGGILMGIPGNLLGISSERFLKSITKIHKTYGDYGRQDIQKSRYELKYSLDNVSRQINWISIGGVVFNITYKEVN